jgi:KUP system potassium uptake protein
MFPPLFAADLRRKDLPASRSSAGVGNKRISRNLKMPPDLSAVSGLATEKDPLANDLAEKKSERDPATGRNRRLGLTLAALGVVYGDIGTSPLYALRESALAAGAHVPIQDCIFGVVSLIVWSLIIVVTLKYVLLIMRADNDGEGGVLALASLAHRVPGLDKRAKLAIGTVAIFGLALFVGDGMLTPAVSVLSAVEGLGVASKTFEPLVLPLSLIILIVLFAFQSRGTARVGRRFGPIMLVWFSVLTVLGLISIIQTPRILMAFSPHYALMLFVEEPWTAFVSLGSVVLAVTGCEALYADMGHFGKAPIRIAWLAVVLPALLITYFGQGAGVLRHPELAKEAFYIIVPHWAHYPMVLLATVATVIASQAVISGVYSITQQAVQLGQLPRMEIRHTSATEFGQIYVPKMNAFLCVGVVLIVLIFKNSNALAAAYGIAVTGVMFLSTMLVAIIAFRQWHWKPVLAIPVFAVLGLIDLAFLSSNALKIVEGGWLPLLIAAFIYIVMETWRQGRLAHLERIRDTALPLDLFLERADRTPMRVAGTAIFLATRTDVVPGALLHSLKHYKVLHERVILANVVVEDSPFVPAAKRIEIDKLGKGFYGMRLHYGFFESPDIPRALAGARAYGLAIDPESTTYFVGRETLVPAEHPLMGRWRTWLYTTLAAGALSPARYFRLTPNRVVELGTQVTI